MSDTKDEGKLDGQNKSTDVDMFPTSPDSAKVEKQNSKKERIQESVASKTSEPIPAPIEEVPKPEVVEFTSRRKRAAFVVKQNLHVKDPLTGATTIIAGDRIQFDENRFRTSNPVHIKYLRAYIENVSLEEVWETPAIDPLALVEDIGSCLDSMQTAELQAACTSRGLTVDRIDDEYKLRYKLMKFLSGSKTK